MFAHGLLAAVAVTCVWVILQNAFMHFRPANNRFRAMLVGYLVSIPFVFVCYHALPTAEGSRACGLLNAYLFHLLLFFQYVHGFYHVERSVTIRFLVELLKHGGQGVTITEVQRDY